jgi:ribonuclease HI
MLGDEPAVTIYTDGGADPNPGPGGWGVVLIHEGARRTIRELSGGEPQTTNNRMELTAAIKALEALNRRCSVCLYTDSEYLRRGITEWMPGWIRRGWRRKGGPIENLDLWQRLAELVDQHDIAWEWVKGHAGNRFNERADALASAAIQAHMQSLSEQNPDAVVVYLKVASLSPSGRPGGWAALIRDVNGERVLSGSLPQATSNLLDIHAAAEALLTLPPEAHVLVYTASDYLRDGITRWVDGWIKRGWKTKEGTPVKHREAWQRLMTAVQDRAVTWFAVRGEPPPEFVRLGEIARQAAQQLAE